MTRPAERLDRARSLGYMVDDSLAGYPIDNNMRFQAQMFSHDYGWVNLWGLGGEYRADNVARLVPICEEFSQQRGVRTRIVELIPTLYQTYEAQEAVHA